MTVTVTVTRLAIGTQIMRAAERLGLECVSTTLNGALVYRLDGVTLTPGQAADYLLEGGYTGSLGRATVVVHPDRVAEHTEVVAALRSGDDEHARRLAAAAAPRNHTRPRVGDLIWVHCDSTTGVRVYAQVPVTQVDHLGCGCLRLTCRRPGPVAPDQPPGQPWWLTPGARMTLRTGCGWHLCEIMPAPALLPSVV